MANRTPATNDQHNARPPDAQQILDELRLIRGMLETLTATTAEPPSEFLDGTEAEAFARCSVRTLQRLHAEGREVGLRKVNRRTVFHRATLARFLADTGRRD